MDTIPDEILCYILRFLVDGVSIAVAARVSRRFVRACRDPRAIHELSLVGFAEEFPITFAALTPQCFGLHTLRALATGEGDVRPWHSTDASRAIAAMVAATWNTKALRVLTLEGSSELTNALLRVTPERWGKLEELRVYGEVAVAEEYKRLDSRTVCRAICGLSHLHTLSLGAVYFADVADLLRCLPGGLRKLTFTLTPRTTSAWIEADWPRRQGTACNLNALTLRAPPKRGGDDIQRWKFGRWDDAALAVANAFPGLKMLALQGTSVDWSTVARAAKAFPELEAYDFTVGSADTDNPEPISTLSPCARSPPRSTIAYNTLRIVAEEPR